MKVCGIDLKGNDAILVALEGDSDNFVNIIPIQRKISLKDALDQKEVIAFNETIHKFLVNGQFDNVGIKARATKGRFAGGSTSFKMEALIQNGPTPVEVIHSATIKAKTKNLEPSEVESQIKAYQQDAFLVARYILNVNK